MHSTPATLPPALASDHTLSHTLSPSLSAEQVSLLARHQLLRPLLRQIVITELTAATPIHNDEIQPVSYTHLTLPTKA